MRYKVHPTIVQGPAAFGFEFGVYEHSDSKAVRGHLVELAETRHDAQRVADRLNGVSIGMPAGDNT